ncbi:MAG: hypothetical protein ACE5FD_19115 [Anaerolineae bacterium]
MNDSILICTLSDNALAERRQQIMAELWPLLQTTRELDVGYAFQFPGTETAVRRAVEFVIQERACCAAFHIEMQLEPNQGPLWLHIRGQEGVKAFISAELGDIISA